MNWLHLELYRPDKSLLTSILGGTSQILLDAEQLVVFFHSFTPSRGASFKMARVQGHGHISYKTINGLAATVRNTRPPACPLTHPYRFNRFSHRADLIELDQGCIGAVLANTSSNIFHISDEEIVSDNLNRISQATGENLPALPIILR